MEERYFSGDAEFEEIEIAEEELIDRYVRGELAKVDQERFEATLAGSPRLKERVEFARTFAEKLRMSATEPQASATVVETSHRVEEKTNWRNKLFGFSGESRTARLAVAFGVLLVLVAGVALLAGWLRLREESRQLAAQQAALEQRQRELDQQAAELKSQADQLAKLTSPQLLPTETPSPQQVPDASPSPRSMFALTLSPGSVRSTGGNQTFRIPAGTSTIEITLRLRDRDYSSYRATIFDADRRQKFRSGSLQPRRDVLTFRVPANNLPRGDYSIALEGLTPTGSELVDDYPFRVIK